MYITTSTGVGWSPLVAKIMVYVKRNGSHFFFVDLKSSITLGFLLKSEFTYINYLKTIQFYTGM